MRSLTKLALILSGLFLLPIVSANAQTTWTTTAGNTLSGTLPASPIQWLGSANPADLILKTNSAERLRITSTGLVGIGTNTPLAPLNVCGANAAPSAAVPANGVLFVGSTATNLALTAGVNSTGGSPYSWIQSRNQGVANTFYTLSMQSLGGNVAIGTVLSTFARLEVQSNTTINNTPDAAPCFSVNKQTSATATRRLFMVPHLYDWGYNHLARNGDFGIFWSDAIAAGGQNSTGALVIAPFAGLDAGMRITANGNVGIGTANPTATLTVNGKTLIGDPGLTGFVGINTTGQYLLYVQQGILTEKVKVAICTTANWADYVFDKNYKLKTISELEAYIKANKHLPNVPSATEMVKEGLDVATMNAKLLEKIEELSLYIIEQNKRIEALEKKIHE